ncbi:MAG: phosphoribosylanthranilate isomerase [Deltaproteobacteria bacterium]|nr:phosphoribosylanthranilate isomerase [Deltaproteobacteria bacterium]MBW2099698.1 phosphoribosylanthranilate isomerase [Deltaproteobacteria bacterium]
MKDGYKVKICGTTNTDDALLAAKEGADYFGVVIEVEFSRRSLTVEQAKELFSSPPLPAVALVFQMKEERLNYLIQSLKPFAVQFLSREDPDLIKRLKATYPKVRLWQSVHLPREGAEVDPGDIKRVAEDYIKAGTDVILFDTVAVLEGKMKFGGTGLTSDWGAVRELVNEIKSQIPVFLAGGINPENVAKAIELVEPDGIDLCSGVESVPGKKDPVKIKALIRAVNESTRRHLN